MSGKLQSHLRTKYVNKTSRHAVSVARFPARPPLLPFYIHKTATRRISKYVTTKNSGDDFFFLLFSGSSAVGKYQFNVMLSVIYGEFTCTEFIIDTIYSPSTGIIGTLLAVFRLTRSSSPSSRFFLASLPEKKTSGTQGSSGPPVAPLFLLPAEHSFFRRGGGWAGGIPMSMNVKCPSPPFKFLLKNVTLPREAVKFIETHLFVVSNLCCPSLFGQAKIS